MKILHMADTHLGYSAYRKVTPDGMNQRELDVYNAFTQVIDYAVKTQPDLILHAGDLFDSVRPTNRAITVAMNQIFRLSRKQIPFVIISGNHETPRLTETGNIFNIFENIDYVYPIYKNKYENITFTFKDKKLTVHAIPHCQTQKEYTNNLKKIKIETSSDFNVFLTHGAVTGIKEFRMNEFNELIIPTNTLKQKFDYIALGHYHKHTQLSTNTFYSGSTERFSIAEANDEKGFIELDLGSQRKQKLLKIKTRSMIDIPPIDCENLSIDQIMNKIKTDIRKTNPKEKIIRLRLKNILPHMHRGIDYHSIKMLTKDAVHFEIKADITKDFDIPTTEGLKINSIAKEFQKFINKQDIPERTTIINLGLKYIQNLETQDVIK